MVATRAPATLGVTVAMIVTSTIFVFFRFVSRGWIVRRIAADDWLILVAWFIAFGFSFSICYGTKVGLGLHHASIPEGWNVPLQKSEYAFSILYNPALMATKTSIIVFFLSFSKEEAIFRWLNYLTLFVVNAAGLALTLVNIFQCHPVDAVFKYPVPQHAQCTDIVALYLSSAPVNIITDLAILFLPMPILTRMRLPTKQKIILVVTFSFGVFVAAVDVVRIVYLQSASFARYEDGHKNGGGKSSRVREQNDFSWYASLSFMWSAVEVNIGIICASVPSLKPLFMRFLPSFIRDVDDKTEKFGSFTSNNPESPISPVTSDSITNPASAAKNGPSSDSTSDGELGFLEFLSAEQDSSMARTATNATWGTATSQRSPTFFDFVNMHKPKNMLRLSNRESFMPVAIVTALFFLWGFAYGLLDVLNGQFQVVVNMSEGQSIGLHAAYFGGYFLGPLTTGRWVLKKFGFKASMITGLVIYGCGTLVFWPSAVLTSYTAFIISNFIVGFGLSNLEIAANPFIILCGPLEYAEIRLNLSQGFQGIGTVLSPLLAKKVLFRNVLNAPSLVDVQWTYLGIALFVILLAVGLYYVPLPEASDEDLDELADRRRAVNTAKLGGKFPVVWVTLALGVFCQFVYVGGQEDIGTQTENLVSRIKPKGSLSPFDYSTVGHTVFAIGRFLSAFLNYLFKPRWILLGLYIGLIITTVLTMSLEGEASIAMLLLVYLFESGVFSIVFAISLRGTGAHTKTASAFMTSAISGGAVFPVIQSAVSDSHGVRYSFCVSIAVFAFGLLFPLYLNIIPEARRQVDPVHESRHRRRAGRKGTRALSTVSGDPNSKNHAFGLSGIVARHRREKEKSRQRQDMEGTCEHVERRSQTGPSSVAGGSGHGSPVDVAAPGPEDDMYEDDGFEILGQGKLADTGPGQVEKGREREVSRKTQQQQQQQQQQKLSKMGVDPPREHPAGNGKGIMHELAAWSSSSNDSHDQRDGNQDAAPDRSGGKSHDLAPWPDDK